MPLPPPRTGWFFPETVDPRGLHGWRAELWMYFRVPHRTLAIRVESPDVQYELYMIFDGSDFSSLPSAWGIENLLCRRISESVLEFEDKVAGVLWRAYAARILDVDGWDRYVRSSNHVEDSSEPSGEGN